MAPTIQTITAITYQAIAPRLADNVKLGNATLAFLMGQGRLEMESGGDYLQEPIIWSLNSTAGSYTGYDPLVTTPQEEVTAATYNWKQYSVCASISGLEQMRNAGPSGVIKAWQTKVRIGANSLKQLLDTHIHAISTTKGPNDILGLDEFIEDVSPPSGVVGGINRGVETWWRNKFASGAVATLTNDINRLMSLCSEGSESPDFGILPYEAWDAIVNQNEGKQRFPTNDYMMKLGFDNIVYRGVTLMPNRNCIGNGVTAPSVATPWNIYLGNSKYLRLRVHVDRNFVPRAPAEPINQDAMLSYILFGGALTLSDSRFQGVLQVTA